MLYEVITAGGCGNGMANVSGTVTLDGETRRGGDGVRLSTQMMIHTGVDERDYWYAAKALSQGLPFPAFSHRTVRWAIILPVALLQKLLGTHPNVYYVAPLLNALAQTLLLYLFGKRIRGRFVGILSAVMLIFFPYQIRAASQVRPEIFSITYMLLCAYLLVLRNNFV